MDEVLRELRRPFTPAAVRWKLQHVTGQGKGGIVVAHIDARLVIERLNTVVGRHWWDEYDEFLGATRCRLTIIDPDEFRKTTREDVGLGADPKSKVSDALKRAGVKFGIGVSIYALSAIYMEVGGGHNKLGTREKFDRQKNARVQVPDLTAENREWLADRYGAWLETDRGRQFGEPLEHGDEQDAQGFDDEGAPTDLPDLPEQPSEEANSAREHALSQRWKNTPPGEPVEKQP